MTSSRLPPGAWLSGFTPAGGGPAFNPPVHPHAALNPPVHPHAAFNPPVHPHAAANPPVGLRVAPQGQPSIFVPGSAPGQWLIRPAGQMPSEPPIPWSGIDPDWVWTGGDETLRAQALRKVRDRISPPVDPRQPRSDGLVLVDPGTREALWRWDEEYRVSAVVAELLGRLVIDGLGLWWMPLPTESEFPRRLFTLTPPGSDFNYSDQIDKVLRAAVEREDRLPEILTQSNDIGIFFDSITGIDRATAPHLRELLEVAWDVSTHLVMLLKNNVAEWRPYQRSGRVLPVIATPGHGSLPSGHATMSMLAAEILSDLIYVETNDPRRAALDRLARRIAFNRVVAGVHFPMDSLAGALLAKQLARVFIAVGRGEALPEPTEFTVRQDSRLDELQPPKPSAAPPPGESASKVAAPSPQPRSPAPEGPMLWGLMWESAQNEVMSRRI